MTVVRVPRFAKGIGALLIGAVIVPLLAVALFTTENVLALRQDVEAAQSLEAGVADRVVLVELHSAVLLERSICHAVQPAMVDGASPSELRSSTDAALAAVDPAARPFVGGDLERLRQLADRDAATCQELARDYDLLADRVSADSQAAARVVGAGAVAVGDPELAQRNELLDTSIEVTTRMQTLALQIGDFYAAPPIDQSLLRSQIAQTANELEQGYRGMDELAPDRLEASWEAARFAVDEQLEIAEEVLQGSLTASTSAVSAARDDSLRHVAALPELAADQTQSRATLLADQARTRSHQGVALASMMLVVSVLVAAGFGRSIHRASSRFADHAHAIGQGQLDIDPLPLRGPSEFVEASAAVNDMVTALRLVGRKADALARSDLDADVLRAPLPGTLGDSLRQSMVVLSESIQAREGLQVQLGHEASHDSLTGIPNRPAVLSYLADALDRQDPDGGSVAAIMVDLDGFKRVNDTHGHAVGDAVLQEIARRLERALSARGMAARLGGDEFLLVIPAIQALDDAIEIATRAVRTGSDRIRVGDLDLWLGASAGIAWWPSSFDADDDISDPLVVLHRADLAVYEAKREGSKSIVVYDSELHNAIEQRRDTENALAVALVEGGQFRLEYQPIFAAESGEIVSVESLIRWDRPGVGLVSPAEFIPVAEASHIIYELDRWVMATAFDQAVRWENHPALADVDMSVNVSGRHLASGRLASDVADALEKSGVEPERVTIEITETVLIDDFEQAAGCLRELQWLGVQVAVDDFGTGYTSLMHLRSLPLNKIKIDQSLVAGVTGADDAGLIRMLVEIARHLGATTVAEGVETAEQREILESLGCDYLQGFLLARPSRPLELEAASVDRVDR